MTLTMIGRISECVLLAYRAPASGVRHLLPPPIEPITHEGFAFWNIVACRVESMRPRGLPRWMGISYLHVAYRLYARAVTADGAAVEGLYFLRSDVDRPLITLPGNLMTDFRFRTAKVQLDADADRVALAVASADHSADASLRTERCEASESHDSCFPSIADARSRLKYRPNGISLDRSGRRLKLAEVFRDESQWHESPLRVTEARWRWLESIGQRNLHLELATRVAPIDYVWRLGRRVDLATMPAAGDTANRGFKPSQ